METPSTIGDWIEATFPGADPQSPRRALRVLEEVIELCKASGANAMLIHRTVAAAIFDANGFIPEFQPDKIPAEAADVFISLCGVSSMRKFNLMLEVETKMLVNRNRTWDARGDGTGQHISDRSPSAADFAHAGNAAIAEMARPRSIVCLPCRGTGYRLGTAEACRACEGHGKKSPEQALDLAPADSGQGASAGCGERVGPVSDCDVGGEG